MPKRGIQRNENVKVLPCYLDTSSGRVLITDDCQDDAKRIKICKIFSNQAIESRLLTMSGDTSRLKDQLESSSLVSKKRDDAPIPIALWLYWLNGGLCNSITAVDWEESVVVIQEKFLLVRWKRILMRSFGKWLKLKLKQIGVENITSSKLIGVEVIWRPSRDLNSESGRWAWVKGGQR